MHSRRRFWNTCRQRAAAGQEGASTVEWAGLTAVITILLVSVIGYIDYVNGGPVADALSDYMDSMVISYEDGGQVGSISPGAGAAAPIVVVPAVAVPAVEPPDVSIPAVVAPAVAVPQAAADFLGGNGDDGGGFWSWVGGAWDGFTDWVGNTWDGVTNWWSELPSWIQGLIIGVAAGLVIVVVALVAVAAGLVAAVGAVALAAAVVVAAAVGAVYGLLAGDDFNGWYAFGLALLGGTVALVAVASGAAAAAWAWTLEVGWPALVAAGRTLVVRVGGLLKSGLGTLWKSIVANKGRLLANYLAYILAKVVILDTFISGEPLSWSNVDDYLLDLAFITLGVLWTPAIIAKLTGRLKLAAELAWGALFAGGVTIVKEIREHGLRLDQWDWAAIGIAAAVGALFKKLKIGTWGKAMTDFVKRMVTTPLKAFLNWVADLFGQGSNQPPGPPVQPPAPSVQPPAPPVSIPDVPLPPAP